MFGNAPRIKDMTKLTQRVGVAMTQLGCAHRTTAQPGVGRLVSAGSDGPSARPKQNPGGRGGQAPRARAAVTATEEGMPSDKGRCETCMCR